MAREYTRQQTEKRKAALQKGSEFDDVRTRVVDMEGSVTRLEEKLGESHSRLEDMFKVIMTSQGCKPPVFPPQSPKVPIPADIGRSAPTLFDGTRTRSLSRADFVHSEAAFTEDLSACFSDHNVIPVHEGETVAEKEKTDEFVEGLLKDPDARGDDNVGAQVLDSVNLGGESDHLANDGALATTEDLTEEEGAVRKTGYVTDSPRQDQVSFPLRRTWNLRIPSTSTAQL